MSLSLLSFNYKSTPVELREKLAISSGLLPEAMREARAEAGLDELMVLSTCNRVEHYFLAPDGEAARGRLKDWLCRRFGVGRDEMDAAVVELSQRAALNHLFRVGCSLESMVIGEPQILGQLKEAYQIAVDSRTTGLVLNSLMPRVFRTAKRTRTETGIARFAVSVSYVAAELAARIFESLEDKTVLVVGAGEMAELAVAHLRKKGIRRLLITNRTYANAVQLAEKCHGEAVRYEGLEEHLSGSDIVISSTGARGCIIGPEMAKRAVRVRKGNPMFLIDIAVPRDIDPAVNDLADVYVYDIDDLQSVADANRAEREREAMAAQGVIDEEVQRYLSWREANAMAPLITAMRTHFAEIGEIETEKALARLKHLPESDVAAVRKLAHTLVNKLLHTPSMRLKAMSEEGNGALYAEAVSSLFDLEGRVNGNGRKPAPAEAPASDNVVRLRQAGKSGA